MTGAAAVIGWLVNRFQVRRTSRANLLEAKKAESALLARLRRTRILSPVGFSIPQGARINGPAGADPWAGTSASGYGSAVRDDLRRKGLTPADYARGATHRKTK